MTGIRRAIGELMFVAFFLFVAVSVLAAPPDPPAITGFRFQSQLNPGKLSDDIVADVYGDTVIVGIIPSQVKDLKLVATFQATEGSTVSVNGVVQQSASTMNNFSAPVSYVVSASGVTKTYRVRLVNTGLPLVYIYTKDAAPVLNKEDYVNGTIRIYPTRDGDPVFSSAMGIRGRGNTTWTLPKKPYRVKLASAASVLGMPSDRDWVLLANYSDKSLMRNSLAYYLGSKMSFAYTPRTQHVDVIFNGIYQGNYQIGEHIKADKDRVNIKELDEEDSDPAIINGGYFLELDEYRDGMVFELASGLPFVIKSPDDVTVAQYGFIHGYMQQTENAIFAANFADPDAGYRQYIDPQTFIDYYWVQEAFKNIDAKDGSSIFYYKDRDAKLKMGPLWDLDVAAGNASVMTGDDPWDFYVRESKWFKRLFEDPAFRDAANARWKTFRRDLLARLPQVIDSFATRLNVSQKYNFYKWDILNQTVWPSPTVLGSYDKEVAYLKDWMNQRIAWIDAQMLGTPKLHSPDNDATVENLSPILRWYRANQAEKYDVQISRSSTFESAVQGKTGIPDTTFTVSEPLEEQATYYWRVKASRGTENSEWSESRSFTTPLIIGLGDTAYGVSVFPNPAGSELYIDIPSVAQIGRAELVDVLGRISASSDTVQGGITRIDVSHLQRGMYLVVLRGGIATITSKVILR